MSARTVAIAPFDNLSGDPAQDYFARGFVEDVATELSRFGTLEVLHPRTVGASFSTRGGDSDRRIPADHIVHGSVRHAGDAVRVNVQLVEAANGRQVWADRYDATAADLHAVQDAIAARIATNARRADRRGPAGRRPAGAAGQPRGVRLLAPRVSSVFAPGPSRRTRRRAASSSGRWRSIPPTPGPTPASRSRISTNGVVRPGRNGTRRNGSPTTTRGARCRSTRPMRWCRSCSGRILVYRRRYDEAAHHLERALLLNPNDTDVLVHAGLCQAYLGDPEAALATANKAMRLNPVFPPWYAAPAGLTLFMLGRDRECLELCASAPTRMFVDVAAFAAGVMRVDRRHDRREALPSAVSRRLPGTHRFRTGAGARRAAAMAAPRQPVQASRGRRTPGARPEPRGPRRRSRRGTP